MSRSSALLLALVGILPYSALGAQGTTLSITSSVTCESCRLVTTRVLTLGDDAANLLHGSTSLWQDGRKRLYAIEHGGRALIVWDSLGRRIATVGSAGQGPGEIAGDITGVVFLRGDSLLVLDRAARWNVYSPTYRFVRTVQMEVTGRDVGAFADGDILVAQQLRTPQRAGFPFHVLDSQGRIERSIGSDSVEIRPSARVDADMMRFGIAAGGQSFWQWESRRYRLTQWAMDGKRLLTLDVAPPPWYTPPPPDEPGTPNTKARTLGALATLRNSPGSEPPPLRNSDPPYSTLFFAGTDVSGRVWVFGTSPRSTIAGPILEIIDPGRQAKVFSGRIPQGLYLLGHSGQLAWSKQTDSLLVPRISVWHVELIGR
jgi:hypothetical protein